MDLNKSFLTEEMKEEVTQLQCDLAEFIVGYGVENKEPVMAGMLLSFIISVTPEGMFCMAMLMKWTRLAEKQSIIDSPLNHVGCN